MYRLKTTANFNIGGGSGTVEEVIHDNTLIGKGTSESPLKVDQSKFAKPTDLNGKQDTLVNGENIKTINNQSILGSGNINIEGGSGGTPTDVQINGSSITSSGTANIVTEGVYNSSTNKLATMSDVPDVTGKQDTLVSGTNIKTINNQSILGSGNITVEGGSGSTSGLSDDIKAAILNCFENVAWINDDGQDYYDALEFALYPPDNISSISAVFNQGQTVVYDTDSLDVLRPMLTVTANYADETSETVTDYTLSGVLTVGTSTITVAYGGKTTTISVTVSGYASNIIHSYDFTQSLEDTVGGLTAQLSETGATRDENGLHITSVSGWCYLGAITDQDVRIEIDIASMNKQFTSGHGRLIMNRAGSITENTGSGFIYNKSGYWAVYEGAWSEAIQNITANGLAGKTVAFEYSTNEKKATIKVDGNTVLTTTAGSYFNPTGWQIGSSIQSFYNITITAVRVSILEG